MSLVIAGERSGAGKTTVTLALLAALSRQKVAPAGRVQAFKVGPDYIDPMFHQAITGVPCRNLDPVLTSESYVQQCFAQHATTADYALVEGVMGLFDGAAGPDDYASTAHIARLLNLPIVLVIDCSRLSRSVAAIAHGYRSLDPRLTFAGLVLNRVGSDRHLELLQSALAPLNLPILGVLRRQDAITIPDRHLGLVPTDELPELHQVFDQLAHLGQTCFDWDALLPLLKPPTSLEFCPPSPSPADELLPPIRLAVARDRAFSFYYADNLDLLQQRGAELVDWSPLVDAALPPGTQGLYFGGGFPEVFAEALAQNQAARDAVRAAVQAGMPTYAECGGLMYLCQQIQDLAGQDWPMVKILPTTAMMQRRLTLGYRQATALAASPLLQPAEVVWGHEFHRSALTRMSPAPLFRLRGYATLQPEISEGWHQRRLHASYLHLHWGSQPHLAGRLLQACVSFKAEMKSD